MTILVRLGCKIWVNSVSLNTCMSYTETWKYTSQMHVSPRHISSNQVYTYLQNSSNFRVE